MNRELNRIAEAYVSMNNPSTATEGMVKVDETSLNRIITNHFERGFVIVSASRSDWIENNPDENERINVRKNRELKRDIIDAGYSFVPVFGGFKETRKGGSVHDVFERSFLIVPMTRRREPVPFDELRKFAFDEGVKFNQDSVTIKPPNDAPHFLVTVQRRPDKDPVGTEQRYFSPNASDLKLNDITQEYFTAMNSGRLHGKEAIGKVDRRFTFESTYFNDLPSSVSEATSRLASGELMMFRRD